MSDYILPGCRVIFHNSFLYYKVHVLPGGVTGYVVMDEQNIPVFMVDGSRQYEWAISKSLAASRAAEYRCR